MLLGDWDEARRLDGSELGIVSPFQRLDPRKGPVAQRHLGLIDHSEALFLKRALQRR